MSGGSFYYAYVPVNQFADELGVRLDMEYQYDFGPVTLKKLREIEVLSRHIAKLMKEVEWLFSGDTSDDSFMERVREIESSNDQGKGAALAAPA